jgi:hypothetical protein
LTYSRYSQIKRSWIGHSHLTTMENLFPQRSPSFNPSLTKLPSTALGQYTYHHAEEKELTKTDTHNRSNSPKVSNSNISERRIQILYPLSADPMCSNVLSRDSPMVLCSSKRKQLWIGSLRERFFVRQKNKKQTISHLLKRHEVLKRNSQKNHRLSLAMIEMASMVSLFSLYMTNRSHPPFSCWPPPFPPA